MKKYVDSWMYGVGIGMFWYLLELLFWRVESQGVSQILVTAIGSGFLGLSGRIYESDDRPLLKTSLLHFVMILSIILVMTSLNGWLEWSNLSRFAAFFLQFIVIYAVIWVVIYAIEKQKVARINEKLRKK